MVALPEDAGSALVFANLALGIAVVLLLCFVTGVVIHHCVSRKRRFR